MHDLSLNKYLDLSAVALFEYSITDFLYKDIAIERKVATDEIIFAIANMLALLYFDIRLLGYTFLIELTACYAVKNDYDQTAIIELISVSHGVEPEFVIDNITAAVNRNTEFTDIASRALLKPVKLNKRNLIADTAEVLGAIYKTYYNYVTEDQHFEFEDNPYINFKRLEFNYGKHRK